jgi:hypothetical protein
MCFTRRSAGIAIAREHPLRGVFVCGTPCLGLATEARNEELADEPLPLRRERGRIHEHPVDIEKDRGRHNSTAPLSTKNVVILTICGRLSSTT